MDGSWKNDAICQILLLRLRPSLLEEVAEQLGRNAARMPASLADLLIKANDAKKKPKATGSICRYRMFKDARRGGVFVKNSFLHDDVQIFLMHN